MNELFLVCPFSKSEAMVRECINPNAFFLTSAAGVFRFKDPFYVESVVRFVEENTIGKLYVTASADCRFARGIVRDRRATEFYADQELFAIFSAHRTEITQLKSEEEQINRLLHLHLDKQKAQLSEMLASNGLKREVSKLVLSPQQLIQQPERLAAAQKVSYGH